MERYAQLLCFLVFFNMRDYTVKQEHLLSYNLMVYFIFLSV